jgi:hypothetical protein
MSAASRCERRHHVLVRVPQSYSKRLAFYNLCLIGLIAYGLGARGLVFVATVLIGFFPVVLGATAKRVLPPTLIFNDRYLTDIKNRK